MAMMFALVGSMSFALGLVLTLLATRVRTRLLQKEITIVEGRIQAIFQNAPAEIYLKDEQGRYVMINPEFERLFQVKNADVVGLLPTDIHDEELGAKTRAHDLQVLNEQKTVVRDDTALTNSGLRTLHTIKFPTYDQSGTLTGLGAIVTDVTELRTVEMEFRQFQKMEAIGQLTGGIAHDFNNLLAVIMGNLELIEPTIDDNETLSCINDALEATKRGAELTSSLLSFARKAPLAPVSIDTGQMISETLRWCQRMMPENIDIVASTSPDLWFVSLDKAMAQTALLNIILNAKDALPKGGRIEVKVSNVHVRGTKKLSAKEEIPLGRYVHIEIADDGDGIDPGVLGEVFVPFFTTKPFGTGSGLGLSMVQGFVQQSNGFIALSSQPNVGTKVQMYFNAGDAPKVERMPANHLAHSPLAVSGHVLVVEDNKGVRDWLCRHFELSGHSVIAVESGDAALQVFLRAPDDFNLIISDIVMPGKLQGPALVNEVRKLKPKVAVIFLSGYPKNGNHNGVERLSGDTFLTKPISSRDLTEAIKISLLPKTRAVHWPQT
ncbi:MAG: PAS domain S-box-containing protein [Candidatus Azotimanducaceae bacterium]|jgi:PAS domain S-box-containing protein